MEYLEFLETKRHSSVNYGIEAKYIPDKMFDFQKHITEYAVRKGRCAIFLDTGLGKTLIELAIAVNYRNETNKPVLIITPLAVAFQFIKEAEKFGIDDIEYSKTGKYTKKIVICNYERLFHELGDVIIVCTNMLIHRNIDIEKLLTEIAEKNERRAK